MFDPDSLQHVRGHRADVDAQEGGNRVGFDELVLPEVVGAQVGTVGFWLLRRRRAGCFFYVLSD